MNEFIKKTGLIELMRLINMGSQLRDKVLFENFKCYLGTT